MAPSTHIVVDLGFGDAGKGTTVDALARRCSTPPLVVRHNGGAQAGHNVVTPDGRLHTFSQFGSATFVPGSRTLLSKHMVLHPGGLMAENEHLVSLGVTDALQRLLVDQRALVITPYHQATNRMRESARGAERHGTCGLGVGETVSDALQDHDDEALRVADLTDAARIRRKLFAVRKRKREELAALPITGKDAAVLSILEDPFALEYTVDRFLAVGAKLHIVGATEVNCQIRESEHVIFEGAQGVLLDEWHGFHPHTTWSTTTAQNAVEMFVQAERTGPVRQIGVVRAYATRHGQGPFPTDNAMLTERLQDTHNTNTGWQGNFRVGWFDAPLTRYALRACPGIDALVVTCVDRLASVPEWSMCHSYDIGAFVSKPGDLQHQEQLTRRLLRCVPQLRSVTSDPQGYVDTIEESLGLPVTMASIGPTALDKLWFEHRHEQRWYRDA